MKLILARDENGGIGICNSLPWHCKEDLQHFSKLTKGSTIVMGRKTWESLGGGLPNRRHIVITSSPESVTGRDALGLTSEEFKKLSFKDCYLIGGATLVDELLPLVTEAFITEIKGIHDADTWFCKELFEEGFELIKETHLSKKAVVMQYKRV